MIIHMTANNRETFPDGAYCPIGQYNRPSEVKEGLTIVLYTTHHGLCLHSRERNMHDDSDFFMTVWNVEKGAPEEICFASTRGWSYPCYGSDVDATPEVQAAYEAWGTREKAILRKLSRAGKAKKLRLVRRTMYQLAGTHGFSYLKLLHLRTTYHGTWQKVMYLLTARIRSGFKLSLRNQVIAWLKNPESKYYEPLTRNQAMYVQDYKP